MEKKLINTAMAYAVAAMAGGVFYREFTKLQGYGERTALGLVHTHLFLLGMMFFLLATLFEHAMRLSGHPRFRTFYVVYNIGVVITAGMLLARGILQVSFPEVSKGLSAGVSGVAGIGHICTGVGLILLFIAARSRCKR